MIQVAQKGGGKKKTFPSGLFFFSQSRNDCWLYQVSSIHLLELWVCSDVMFVEIEDTSEVMNLPF
jgi:hypothetical protein